MAKEDQNGISLDCLLAHRQRRRSSALRLAQGHHFQGPQFPPLVMAVTDFQSLCRTSRGPVHLTSDSAALATQDPAHTLPEAALERITVIQGANKIAHGKLNVEDWKTVQRTTQVQART